MLAFTKGALTRDVKAFQEVLENDPEKWFDNPCGWVNRRKACSSVGSLFLGAEFQYRRRWFVLDHSNEVIKVYKGKHRF
jgi:hypothetical protein